MSTELRSAASVGLTAIAILVAVGVAALVSNDDRRKLHQLPFRAPTISVPTASAVQHPKPQSNKEEK